MSLELRMAGHLRLAGDTCNPCMWRSNEPGNNAFEAGLEYIVNVAYGA